MSWHWSILSEEIRNWQPHYCPEEEVERARLAGIKIINREHKNYPISLKNINDPPILLYVRGDSTLLNAYKSNLAVVGSRRPSHYGINSCKHICNDAVYAGMNIVSGLAYGIDTTAHETAVLAKKNLLLQY